METQQEQITQQEQEQEQEQITQQEQEQITQQERSIGQIKFFDKDKGFGFVRRLSDDSEYFVHFTEIRPKTQCWNVLYKGEYVEFDISDGIKGLQANNITGIYNGSLMCDNEFEYKRKKTNKNFIKTDNENN